MASFFLSSVKIQTGQTFVSVPSENGLNYRPGGRIDLYIPPTSKFIDLSQTKLKMNVSIAMPSSASNEVCRLQLDAETGLHSLIRSVRVFTGRKTALLEEIEGYDVLTALRFDYEKNKNIVNKRVLTDGATGYDPACRGTLGTTKTDCANCFSNPWFPKAEGTQTVRLDNDDYQVVTGELELNTGLFRNEAVFPALLTDGLFIEILLQDSKRVFRQLDSTVKDRRLHLNPLFHSINGSDNGATALADAAVSNVLYFQRANNQTSVSTFPFVVGQSVALALDDNSSFTTTDVHITQIEQVSGVTYGTAKTKVTLSASVTNNLGADVSVDDSDAYLVSQSVERKATFDPTFTVSNVFMVVAQISVPDGYENSMMQMMKEGGTLNYDYRSFTNYRYSQVSSDLVANIRLPLIESRATSILCVPTDATVYSAKQALSCSNTYLIDEDTDDVVNRSNRSGLVGIVDELQNYQLIYDGRINPSRKVDVSKISNRTSISQQWCIEAEKALAMADIEPLSFRAFRDNFFVGRALALGANAVYDARGKDFSLQVEYTGASGPAKNHLWMNFVSHLRRLVIKQGSIDVLV